MTKDQILEQIERWVLSGRISFDELQELADVAYAKEQQEGGADE